MLWCTASSSYLLNGIPSRRILHCRGVRQGDPLSPMLFLLSMEHLHRLFQKAQQAGLISSLSRACDSFRASLYADDATIFIKLTMQELQVTDCILDMFAQASGLVTNMNKIVFSLFSVKVSTLISYLNREEKFLTSHVNTWVCLCTLADRPKTMLHQLIQKIGTRLPGWKRRIFFLSRERVVSQINTDLNSYLLPHCLPSS